jgi:ankyrin repeat protein
VQALLDGGADVNAKPNERCPPAFGLGDPVCGTALIAASLFGRLDVVKALLARGAAVNAKNGNGETALLQAYASCRLDVVQALLANGADVNARYYDNGVTALMVRPDLLLTLAPDACQPATCPVLDLAQALLAKGADVNAKNKDGMTPLFWHSLGGLDIVKALLDRGADVNAKDNFGGTALMKAGNRDIVQLLLDRGADVNAKDNAGFTALVQAAAAGNHDVVQALLDRGADVTDAALAWARDAEVKALLEHAGAKP